MKVMEVRLGQDLLKKLHWDQGCSRLILIMLFLMGKYE